MIFIPSDVWLSRSVPSGYTDSLFTGVLWQVLSGQQPWAEIQEDVAVIVQLYQGRTPGRPSLRPIEDLHWKFIEQCWSPAGSRPSADDVVISIQRFLSSHPPSKSLREVLVLRALSELKFTGTISHDSREDALVVPDLTNKIHEADEKFILHGSFSDVYKYLHDSDQGTKEVGADLME